jgi:hypothetical protein
MAVTSAALDETQGHVRGGWPPVVDADLLRGHGVVPRCWWLCGGAAPFPANVATQEEDEASNGQVSPHDLSVSVICSPQAPRHIQGGCGVAGQSKAGIHAVNEGAPALAVICGQLLEVRRLGLKSDGDADCG